MRGPATKVGTRTIPKPASAAADAGLAVREEQTAGDLDLERVSRPGIAEAPDERLGKVGVDDAVVARERRGLGRLAPSREIGGRGGDDDAVVAELAGDEAGVGGLADPDGGVEAFVDQVRHPVGKMNVEQNLGIGADEVDQRRLELDRAEGGGNGEGEPAARVAVAVSTEASSAS